VTTLLLISLCSLAASALLAPARRVSATLALAASILLLTVGFTCAGGWTSASIDLGSWLGFGPTTLAVDRLSGIFVALAGASGAAVSLTYLEHPPRRLVLASHGLLLFAITIVFAVDQAFVFLLAWEGLTLVLYLLAGADRERPGTLVAGYFTGTMNKLGGGALLAAFGLLYAQTGSFRFVDWAHAAPTLSATTRGIAFLLLLIGFGTKVGMSPFQGWLPVGHAAAPGASSATLSGIAINAGFYGLWRLVFHTLAPAALWWGELTLVVGGLTALIGILYAIAQDDIKRFLGFSTIEHSGIALLGFGVALVGSAAHQPKLAAAGLLAATLHVIAHALSKTLAFLGADRVARGAGTRELEPLGGLSRALPRTAFGFAVATLTLAAIPPLAGFVSEWLTFEALLQGFRLDSTVARLVMSLGAALLALTAGLALLAFAKLFGTVFLGRARQPGEPHEPRDFGLGLVALAAVGLALGPAAPWEIRWVGPRPRRHPRLRPLPQRNQPPARPRPRLRKVLRARANLARDRAPRLRPPDGRLRSRGAASGRPSRPGLGLRHATRAATRPVHTRRVLEPDPGRLARTRTGSGAVSTAKDRPRRRGRASRSRSRLASCRRSSSTSTTRSRVSPSASPRRCDGCSPDDSAPTCSTCSSCYS